jgi:hypothetical protein
VRAPRPGRLETEVRGRLPGRSGRQTGEARVFAGAERTVRRRGDVVLTLRIGKRYDRTLRRARRLRAQAAVDFEARDGTVFERRIGVVFTAPPAKKSSRSRRGRGRS